jgi:hypothetical protein
MNNSDDPTIKVLFRVVGKDGEAGTASDALLQGIVAMGCEFEGANRRYIAINIPPVVELAAVRDYLVENALTWEHADPSYAEIYPDEA